jgi:hypothetical protein
MRTATGREMIRPDYKIIYGLHGGMNTSVPPDQIGDEETADSLNVVMMDQAMGVDFGVKKLGSKVYGNPLQAIEWTGPSGTIYDVLVTDRTFYVWNTGVSDWLPIPITTTSNPTVNGTVTGAGTNPAIAFTGTAQWTSGKLIGALMDNGRYLVGVSSGTTSPVTLATPLPVGRTIPNGNTILPLPTFTSDGTLAIDWTSDPQRARLQFVNGFDIPQEFNGTLCTPMGDFSGISLTTARYINRFNYVTVLAATTESGVFRTYRIRRSATGDSTNWSTLNAGFDDLIDTADDITGLLSVNPKLVVARRDTLVSAAYYGLGKQVFWYSYGSGGVGCVGLRASTETRQNSLVLDNTGIYEYDGNTALRDVGTKIFNNVLSFTGELAPGTFDKVQIFYVPLLDESWLLYQATGTTDPQRIFRYSHRRGTWHKRTFASPLAFRSLGVFTNSNAKRWIDLTNIWSAATRPWNSGVNQAKFSTIVLCGATDNQVYQYDYSVTGDNGIPTPWYFTSKDYPMPEDWTTVDGVVFYGQGTIQTVEISLNGGTTYQTIGQNVTMGPTWMRMEIDCSVTGNFLRLRVSGLDPAFKLSWFAFKTMKSSEL